MGEQCQENSASITQAFFMDEVQPPKDSGVIVSTRALRDDSGATKTEVD